MATRDSADLDPGGEVNNLHGGYKYEDDDVDDIKDDNDDNQCDIKDDNDQDDITEEDDVKDDDDNEQSDISEEDGDDQDDIEDDNDDDQNDIEEEDGDDQNDIKGDDEMKEDLAKRADYVTWMCGFHFRIFETPSKTEWRTRLMKKTGSCLLEIFLRKSVRMIQNFQSLELERM